MLHLLMYIFERDAWIIEALTSDGRETRAPENGSLTVSSSRARNHRRRSPRLEPGSQGSRNYLSGFVTRCDRIVITATDVSNPTRRRSEATPQARPIAP